MSLKRLSVLLRESQFHPYKDIGGAPSSTCAPSFYNSLFRNIHAVELTQDLMSDDTRRAVTEFPVTRIYFSMTERRTRGNSAAEDHATSHATHGMWIPTYNCVINSTHVWMYWSFTTQQNDRKCLCLKPHVRKNTILVHTIVPALICGFRTIQHKAQGQRQFINRCTTGIHKRWRS
jgi:hypothetical protein